MVRFVITIILLLATAAANHSFSRPEAEIARKPLKDFPSKIGDWQMIGEQTIDEKAMEVLLVDDYLMRSYRNGKGEIVHLYVGYFRSQKEGKQVHSPRQCLPGAGWSIVERSELLLASGTGNPGGQRINSFLMGKGSERDLFLWWYQGRGRIYANEYLNKLYLIWDGLTRNRTDGALVRINSQVKSSPDDTLKLEMGLVESLSRSLSAFIPD
jgi:EpsI family protein